MPPIKKFLKEDIVSATLKIVEREGFASINARKIAKELGSSVQPIFKNFASMEEVNRSVYDAMYETYKSYMERRDDDENEYKQLGISYVKFAKEHPEFFKAIFMQETDLSAENFVIADQMGDKVIKAGQKLTGLSYDEQKSFHVRVWIFTHGIACLAATKTIALSDEEIKKLLETTVIEMLTGKIAREKENR